MRKNGFTLVELLAVIVILAIIALIAIPLIGNVIEKAKIRTLENSVNGLVESADMYYANETIKGETISQTTFDFEDGVQTSEEKLSYRGKVENGKLILYTDGKAAVCIDDNKYYAYKNKDSDEVISGIGTCVYDGSTGQFGSDSTANEATAEAEHVLEGKTIYTTKGLVVGTMKNHTKDGIVNASIIEESEDKALITIPSKGYYDETTKISVPINKLSSGLSNIKDVAIIKNRNYSKTIDVAEYKEMIVSVYVINAKVFYIEGSSDGGTTYTTITNPDYNTDIIEHYDISQYDTLRIRNTSSTYYAFGSIIFGETLIDFPLSTIDYY